MDWRVTTSYCTFIGGNLVIWRSKKQGVVVRSSVEVKYRAMGQRICEVLWIKTLHKELSFEPKEPMKIHYDNKAVIGIA